MSCRFFAPSAAAAAIARADGGSIFKFFILR